MGRVRLTSSDLRELAKSIDNNVKYNNGCGVIYATMKQEPNGKEYLEFEQPCAYSDCVGNYYVFKE